MRLWITLQVICASAALLVAGPRQFRLGVDGVELHVRVTEGRRPVRGLTAADFDVLDDGVRQQGFRVAPLDAALDVIALVDMSDAQSNVPAVERAVRRVQGHLQRGDHFSLVTSTDQTTTLLTAAVEDHPAIRLVPLAGAERPGRLNDAILHILAAPPGEEARRRVLVVFADGADTGSVATDERVVENASRAHTTVLAVSRVADSSWSIPAMPRALQGHPDRVPLAFFRSLAAVTGGRVFTAPFARIDSPGGNAVVARPNPDLIDRQILDALDALRSAYVIQYALSAAPAAGWHDVRVLVPRHPTSRVETRQRYWVDPLLSRQ